MRMEENLMDFGGAWETLSEILRRHEVEVELPLLRDVVEDIVRNGTRGRAPDLGELGRRGYGNGGYINAIPSSRRGACAGVLLVVCYDKDSLHERLREMLYHAGIYCRGHNRKVVFITSHWEANIYEVHARAVETLRRDGVDFIFILASRYRMAELSV